jgi:tripartite-type tricarboxylate transporter receptor subunit TctC
MRKALTFIVCALGLMAGAASVQAQDFPSRPLKVIVPQPPGGGFDVVGRVIADKLSGLLGQQVVVENRPGAGTLVGTEAAATAAPDGYTLLVGATPNLAFNPGLYEKLPYDPLRDFVPLGLAVGYPYILVTRKDLPQSSLRELLDHARANADKITYASGGNGTGQHIGSALITHLAGVKMTHVPYRGAQAAYTDLLAGRVDIFYDNLQTAKPHVESGTVKAFATSMTTRHPTFPNLQTIKEATGLDFDMVSWFGYFAPAKTPQPVVVRLRAEFAKVMQMPDVAARFDAAGGILMRLSPAETEALVKRDIERWSSLIKAAGLKAE